MPLRNLTVLFIAAIVSILCYNESVRNRHANSISEVIHLVSQNYVEPVSEQELLEGSLDGMMKKLDRHSGFIPRDELRQFQQELDQEFGGIGILVEMSQEGYLTILSPVPGTPAYKAGLLAGDTILAIEGQSTEGFSLQDAVRLMRGKPGSLVKVNVLHKGGSEPEEYEVMRAIISVESIRGDRRKPNGDWVFTLEDYPNIGYVRMTKFGEHTVAELAKTLDALSDIDGLIIDLRGNAGGLLNAAVGTSDLFIPEGAIVSTRGRYRSKWRNYEASEATLIDKSLPVAVLVDRSSASASEIFAACLQDHQRAAVVGERSFGKGTVQNVIPVDGGKSALRLTTATYWRPSGKNIHRHEKAKEDEAWGVEPDPGCEIKLTDKQFLKLFEQRRDRDVLRSEAIVGETEDKETFKDPHIEKAVERLLHDDGAIEPKTSEPETLPKAA